MAALSSDLPALVTCSVIYDNSYLAYKKRKVVMVMKCVSCFIDSDGEKYLRLTTLLLLTLIVVMHSNVQWQSIQMLSDNASK